MLFFSTMALIISNALNNRSDLTIQYNRIGLLILIFSLFFSYSVFFYNYINNGIIILNGLFCLENYSIFFSIIIIFISSLILSLTSVFYLKIKSPSNGLITSAKGLVTSGIPRVTEVKDDNRGTWKNKVFIDTMNEHYKLLEYPLIIIFCITGAIFLMLSFDIISIFLSIELQSYALYLICSLYRNSESSTNAGLTYFLLGGLSSCIILLGLGLLYVNTGNTNLENLYILNNISDIFYYNIIYNNANLDNISLNLITNSTGINSDNFILSLVSSINTQYIFIQISLLIMSVGFLFKIGAAPFHFWSPDVYDAVPTITTSFIANIPKISVLIFLYKILYYTSSNIVVLSWVNNIILSCILSLIIGSVLGLTQYRIKRLYAYSTISHLGFILMALSINNAESSKAFFFYLLQYSITNINAFFILIVIGYSLKYYIINKESYNAINLKDISYSPVQLLSQLRGFYQINPILTASLVLTLFSFAGIPPLMGFFGKQMIFSAALNTNLFFIVIIGIISSVISTVYYLVIIKIMCFESSTNHLKQNKIIHAIRDKNSYFISSFYSLSITLITLIIVLFIFFETEIIKILNIVF